MSIQIRKEAIKISAGGGALRFLHVSDIHLWLNGKVLLTIEDAINQGAYELLVLTGDYYDTLKGAKLFCDFLERIAPRIRVVFIRGNHDFLYGKKIANRILNIPNCFCVENEVYTHTYNGQNYQFTSWRNRKELKSFQGSTNIVLVHNPKYIKEAELENIHLILAGHLHGGQIVLFKTKKGYSFPACLFYKYCADKLTIGKTTLIVNRGMGDTLPVRINCPHEMIDIELS